MSLVSIHHCCAQFSEHFELVIPSLIIKPLQHTVILGSNGSGKSALAALLAGQGEITQGKREVTTSLTWVSVEQQQALIEAEKQKDCADILDVIPVASKAEEILFDGLSEVTLDKVLLSRLLSLFNLSQLLPKPFRALSTGETRKLLLTRSILADTKLLILDEPWDGLDSDSCAAFNALLDELSDYCTIVMVINRLSEVPLFCQQLILMQQGKVHWQTKVEDNLKTHLTHLRQLLHLQQTELVIPDTDSDSVAPQPLDSHAPLVKLSNVKVSYGGNTVFSGLNWTINPSQHWQVTGPNGSGKTCLLNLITGDHPQCYVNDIYVFGFQRGNGESIWQIKQYIGYLSNGFHLDYKVNCSALHVVLSGFYNSVGLYQQPSSNQQQLAKQWLALMALEKYQNTPFQELSFGDQRMILIARAMVKHPTLLILDEPCNGLDDINRLKVLALIDILALRGSTTLLYVNHHQEDVIPSIQNHLSMTDFN